LHQKNAKHHFKRTKAMHFRRTNLADIVEICKEILVLQGYKQTGTHIAKCYVEPLVRTLGVQDERQFAIES
jgi:hypothetical protein